MMQRAMALCCAAMLLSSCAATDSYSSRAKTYNTESNNLGNEMLLLNVLRASHRLPLQFTDLQSVSGTTTAAGSIGLSTPVGGFPADTTRTINPAVSGGLQTVFQAVVLNSQDFYQGVSSPISSVQASYFVRTVKPSELIFDLLLQRIVIYRGDPECQKKAYFAECAMSFANDPRNRQGFNLFQMTLGYLLRLGLSIEAIPFRSREMHLDTKDGARVTSQIVKDDNVRTVARYCFRPRDDAAKQAIVGDAFLCGPEAARKFFQNAKTETDQSPVVQVPPYVVDKLIEVVDAANSEKTGKRSERDFDDDPERVKDNLRAFKRRNVRIELTTRSTLDMFDFLGSVVAATEKAGRPIAMIRGVIEERSTRLPCDLEPSDDCSPILALTTTPTEGLMSVDFQGRDYVIPADGRLAGYSPATLAILKQVLGLNTSSKSVPVPAIITGIPSL